MLDWRLQRLRSVCFGSLALIRRQIKHFQQSNIELNVYLFSHKCYLIKHFNQTWMDQLQSPLLATHPVHIQIRFCAFVTKVCRSVARCHSHLQRPGRAAKMILLRYISALSLFHFDLIDDALQRRRAINSMQLSCTYRQWQSERSLYRPPDELLKIPSDMPGTSWVIQKMSRQVFIHTSNFTD